MLNYILSKKCLTPPDKTAMILGRSKDSRWLSAEILPRMHQDLMTIFLFPGLCRGNFFWACYSFLWR